MTTRRARVRFNYKDYCLLPEDKRYELIDGELYMPPAPGSAHQRCLLRLARIVADFVEQNALGEVFIAPFDVILSDEDVLQPDLLFVSKERQGIISERGCEGPPDLVLEVLSPSTQERDRELKRKVYANYGVRELWLVDPTVNTIEVFGLEPEGLVSIQVYGAGSQVQSPIIPGFSLPAERVFQEP